MQQRNQLFLSPAPLLLVGLLSGCATTATVTTRDGTVVEARITGGDARHLLLTSEYGVDQVVRRAEVRDIDHPGNVLALVGGILSGAGAMNLLTFLSACAGGFSSSCVPFVATGGTMLASGAGMLIWGLWTWLGSRNMVTDTVTAAPVAAPEPEPLAPSPPPPALLPGQPL